VLTHLNPLDANTLRLILTEPKNALVKQYVRLFEMDNIGLSFEDAAYDYIVEKAVEYKLGARGLRSICELVMKDAMFEMPSTAETQLFVSKSYVEEKMEMGNLEAFAMSE
jgi:ATP-dependent Clp protease ATP-binding subunit ClpX